MIETNSHMIDLLRKEHDIDISMYDESFMKKTIIQYIEHKGCRTFQELSRLITTNKEEIQPFLDSFQVGYSEFFRNPLTFSVLERIILPDIIYNKRKLKSKEIRIWSAACAGGQETYSIAMLLADLKNGEENNEYRIFGTDRSRTLIAKAQKGEYHAESIGYITRKRIDRWFIEKGKTYAIKPELKKNIRFSEFDLLCPLYGSPPESIFGGFDIVVCANLMFYYKPEYRRIIVDKIIGSLAENGLVITGETEREIMMDFRFKELYPHSAIFRIR